MFFYSPYVTKNNRRALWCCAEVGGQRLLLASLHNDSYDSANNLLQTQQILDFTGGAPAILAGDFNANPDEPSIRLVRASGRFAGAFDGPLTFPADDPQQRLDYLFAPSSWEMIEHRVLKTTASDHCPVVSTFRVRW